MARKKSRHSQKDRIFDLGNAVALIMAILTVYLVYINLPAPNELTAENPPEFIYSKSPLLGNLDANNCLQIGQEYSADDESSYQIPEGLDEADENTLHEGLNFYHHEVYEEGFMTVQDIMDSIVPIEDNRVFFLHYSNGFDQLESGFHIYPPLPNGTDTSGSTEEVHNIDAPEDLIIFPNLAFGIYSCEEAGIMQIEDQSSPGLSTYVNPNDGVEYVTAPELVVSPEGWIAMSAPSDMGLYDYFACNGHRIKSIWVQNSPGFNGFSSEFKYDNVSEAYLEDHYYTVWLNIGDNDNFEALACDDTGHLVNEEPPAE